MTESDEKKQIESMQNAMDSAISWVSQAATPRMAKSPRYLVGVLSVREHLQSLAHLLGGDDDYRRGQLDALAEAQEAVCGLYNEGNAVEPEEMERAG